MVQHRVESLSRVNPHAEVKDDMAQTETEWIASLAHALGVEPPNEAEREALLGIAATAAHASERTAAPISCWLVARAGLNATEGKLLADRLAEKA